MSRAHHRMDPVAWAFADRLCGRLIDLGWTQAELARRAGVSADVVGAWCDGTTLPGLVHAVRLARALGCQVEDLIQLEPA